jgi:hypothetical protein
MVNTDTAYCERCGGAWELWTYSGGRRVYLLHAANKYTVVRYCNRHRYRVVWV